MAPAGWHILTGEYPPQPGGVSDYSAQVADGLSRSGAEVHVWAPGGWSRADLVRLGRDLDRFPAPRRLLVQYVPNAWGYRGLNLGFCRWLVRRRAAGDDVRPMFHELWYRPEPGDPLRRRLLPPLQRRMVRAVLRASTRVYVSIPWWERLLRGLWSGPVDWLPVPSNVPVVNDPDAVAEARRRVAPSGGAVVGCFGTFQGRLAGALAATLADLLRGGRVGLLIGRGSREFAERLAAGFPPSGERLRATGGLPPRDVSVHLQACDLLVQPYPEGVTSRRGTVMAGVSHGRPVVTTSGPITEPVWSETGCVALAPLDALAATADALLADPEARARLGAAARATYDRHFALERTVEALLRG